MDALAGYSRLARRSTACLAAGIGLAALNLVYLADELPYFTATPAPFVVALYVVAVGLVVVGVRAFLQARALRATAIL